MQTRWIKGILSGAAIRIAILPLTGACVLLQSFLLIKYCGAPVFAIVALLWSIVFLVPFADLGVGAAVTNAVAMDAGRSSLGQETLALVFSAIRILIVAAVAVMAIATGIALYLKSSGIEVDGFKAEYAVLWVGLAMAVGLPISLWQRVALGQDNNNMVQLCGAIISPIALAVTACAIKLDMFELAAASPMVGALAAAVVGTTHLLRGHEASYRGVVRGLIDKRRYPQQKVAKTAIPMLLVLILQPLALQTDRLLILWKSTVDALAEYSLVAQFYLPALAVMSAGAASLWPKFASAANDRIRTREIFIAGTISTVAMGIGLSAGMLVIGPPLATIIAGDEINVAMSTWFAFSFLLITQSAAAPLGMLLTNASGLRVQAGMLAAMLTIKLAIVFPTIGSGPQFGPLSSAIAIWCTQIPGNGLAARKTRLSNAHGGSD